MDRGDPPFFLLLQFLCLSFAKSKFDKLTYFSIQKKYYTINPMFTMRRKDCGIIGDSNGANAKRRCSVIGTSMDEGKRGSTTFGGRHLQQQQEHHRQNKTSRNSLLIASSSSTDENVVHLSLRTGCFRRAISKGSMSSMAIYNLICSLLVFALRVFTETNAGGKEKKCRRKHSIADPPLKVLLEAPKIPMKALRIVLRACQSALAYRITHIIILLEADTFLGFQQRVAMDLLLLDFYTFKVLFCPRQKLAKHGHLGFAALYDLQQFWKNDKMRGITPPHATFDGLQQRENGGWIDLKKGFLDFLCANPTYFANNPATCANPFLQHGGTPASLAQFARKDRIVLIELVEFDLDSVLPLADEPPPIFTGENVVRQEMPKIVKRIVVDRRHSTKNDAFSHSLPPKNGQKMASIQHGRCQSIDGNKNNNGNGNGRQLNDNDGDDGQLIQQNISDVTKSVQKLTGWLGENGERRMAKLEMEVFEWSSMGDNEEMEKLDEKRTNLCTEIDKIIDELASIADKLAGLEKKCRMERPKELIAVGQLLLGVQSRVHALRAGLNRLSLRMENARRFKGAIIEFHAKANQLLKDLCGGENESRTLGELNADRIRARIAETRGKMQIIEKSAMQVTEAGSTFCTLLRQKYDDENVVEEPSKNQENDGRTLDWISTELVAIGERRRRCAALVDLKAGRLNQLLEIVNCEQFGEQIIERFNELLKKNSMKVIEELNSRRNGKRLVDYARQMAALAGILRKINRIESASSDQFNHRLNTLWQMLQRKYEMTMDNGGNKIGAKHESTVGMINGNGWSQQKAGKTSHQPAVWMGRRI